jgi:outer membrane cobalamin receptor
MKKIILLLVLCFLTLSLFSMTTVRGVVRDSVNNPIPDVLISSNLEDARTSTNGSFQITFKENDKNLYFYKLGYKRESFIVLNPKKYIRIVLKIQPFKIPPIHIWDRYSSSSITTTNENRTFLVRDNPTSNIAGFLAHQGNFLVQGTSLTGEKQTLSLLGFKSRHVAVSLDGIPLNVTGEDFDLSTIPLESVESVELLQSNTSSLVGSGGMGGMLNIHTKQFGINGKSSFESMFSGGSLGYQKESLRGLMTSSRLQAMVYYSNQKADNNFLYSTQTSSGTDTSLKRAFNRKYIQDVMVHLGYMQKDWNVRYAFNFQNFDKQLPGPVNFLLVYQKANITGETLRQSLDIRNGNTNHEFRLMLYQDRENTLYDNTKAPLPVYYIQSRNDLVKSGAQSSWDKTWMDMKFHSFLEYWKEDYTYEEPTFSAHDIPQKAQELFACAEQVEYVKNLATFNFHSILNGRIDHHTAFEHFTTYRISGDVTYKSWSDVIIGGSYGTGFTVPSFYSLYWKGDAQAMGNSELQPERSHGWQVFTKWKIGENNLQVSYHQNQLDDMILWIQTYQWGGVWEPVNIAKASMKSFISELAIKPYSYLNLDASFTYTSAFDRSVLPNGEHSAFYGKHLVFLPEKLFRCSASLEGKRQFLHLYYSYTGKQWTKTDNLIPPLKPYGIVDVEAGTHFLQKNWKESLSLSAENILNHKYEIYPYIPEPGFHWQLQLNIAYQL